MNVITKISIAAASIACLSFQASANENESNALLSIVKSSVHQTVSSANESIDLGLQKSILTNIHNLSFGNDDAPKGQVKIIDLASTRKAEENEDESELLASTKAE